MISKILAVAGAAWIMTLAAVAGAPAAPQKAQNFLSDQHIALGLGCKDCHGDADKADGVSMDQCLTCHESYEKLKQSPRTRKLHPNPHDGHYPDLDCNTCHHGHKAQENYCDSCHK